MVMMVAFAPAEVHTGQGHLVVGVVEGSLDISRADVVHMAVPRLPLLLLLVKCKIFQFFQFLCLEMQRSILSFATGGKSQPGIGISRYDYNFMEIEQRSNNGHNDLPLPPPLIKL